MGEGHETGLKDMQAKLIWKYKDEGEKKNK